MNEIKAIEPVYKPAPKRNASICNLRTRITKVKRYLKVSTSANMRSIWEGQITKYQTQLAKVEAHALHAR
ncbi:MAG: hypothetical protein WCG79_10540 [Verrucomicrobiota bacterium]